MTSEEVNIKEHLNNLVDALIALSPSRNYLTQFLMILPQDYPTLYDAYPDLLKDGETREFLEKGFGVSLQKEPISIGYGKFGETLVAFIGKLFEKFEDKEFIDALNLLLKDIRAEPIPNLHKEWLKLKIEGALSEPTYGSEAAKVIRIIGEGKFPDVPDFVNMGMEEHRVRRVIELLRGKYRLIERGSGYIEALRITKEGFKLTEEIKKYPDLVSEAKA